MLGISLKAQGFAEMRKKILSASKRASGDGGITFTDYLAGRLYKEQIKHFEDELGPDGRWDPLSPITISRRRKGGAGAKILQDTRRMLSSILPSSTKNTASVVCNVEYGITHQEGTKHIPQRKFLWVSDEFLADMTERFAKFIKGDITA